jgi:hypothetical protein
MTVDVAPKPPSVEQGRRLRLERVVSGVAFVGGIGLIVAGARYGLTGPNGVGPGTFPAIAGALMALSSLLQLPHLLVHPAPADGIEDFDSDESAGALPDRAGAIRVATVLGATVAAAAFLDRLGFVIAVGLYLAVVLKVVGHRSYLRSGLVGMLTALVIGEVFSRALGVSLPTSPVGLLEQLGI